MKAVGSIKERIKKYMKFFFVYKKSQNGRTIKINHREGYIWFDVLQLR